MTPYPPTLRREDRPSRDVRRLVSTSRHRSRSCGIPIDVIESARRPSLRHYTVVGLLNEITELRPTRAD